MKKLFIGILFSLFALLAAPVSAVEGDISWSVLKRADGASPVEFNGQGLFCHAYGPVARCVLAKVPPAGMDCVVAVTPDKSHWIMVHTIPGGEGVEGDGKITACGKVIPKGHWWWVRAAN